jgi:hypothetical protein
VAEQTERLASAYGRPPVEKAAGLARDYLSPILGKLRRDASYVPYRKTMENLLEVPDRLDIGGAIEAAREGMTAYQRAEETEKRLQSTVAAAAEAVRAAREARIHSDTLKWTPQLNARAEARRLRAQAETALRAVREPLWAAGYSVADVIKRRDEEGPYQQLCNFFNDGKPLPLALQAQVIQRLIPLTERPSPERRNAQLLLALPSLYLRYGSPIAVVDAWIAQANLESENAKLGRKGMRASLRHRRFERTTVGRFLVASSILSKARAKDPVQRRLEERLLEHLLETVPGMTEARRTRLITRFQSGMPVDAILEETAAMASAAPDERAPSAGPTLMKQYTWERWRPVLQRRYPGLSERWLRWNVAVGIAWWYEGTDIFQRQFLQEHEMGSRFGRILRALGWGLIHAGIILGPMLAAHTIWGFSERSTQSIGFWLALTALAYARLPAIETKTENEQIIIKNVGSPVILLGMVFHFIWNFVFATLGLITGYFGGVLTQEGPAPGVHLSPDPYPRNPKDSSATPAPPSRRPSAQDIAATADQRLNELIEEVRNALPPGNKEEPPLDRVHKLAYVMRNLGWIAITLRADRMVTLAYSDLAVDPAAARCTRDWLVAQRDGIASVRRHVEIDGQWIEAAHPNLASASAALEVLPAMRPRRPDFKWSIERLPLEAIRSKPVGTMLAASRLTKREPGRLSRIASQLGLLDTSAVFRVEGDSVTTLWTGPRLGVDGPSVMGRNVRERADLRYAEMVRLHTLGAVEEPDGTYHHNIVSIDGRGYDYVRLALAEPMDRNGTHLVLTTTEILGEIPL